MMSSDNIDDDLDEIIRVFKNLSKDNEAGSCASCGISEVDDVKLKECDDCDLVRYCSDECRQDHKSKHEEECKKRAAELHDKLLFRQPESTHLGDCPICFIPLPYDGSNSTFLACCGKSVCEGCCYANQKREFEERLAPTCPFCRHPVATSQMEGTRMFRELVDRVGRIKDPVVTGKLGSNRYEEGDYKGAFEYWTKATELGHVQAHYQLSIMYQLGQGVEKSEKKQIHHLERAAIAGHAGARHNLGAIEYKNGNVGRAFNHWMIAAKQGNDESLAYFEKMYENGIVLSDDFGTMLRKNTLRAHQAAVDATKSPDREAAVANRLFRMHVR